MINPCENREETGLEGKPVWYMLCGNCETRIGLKGRNDATLYTCPNCGDLNEGNPNLEPQEQSLGEVVEDTTDQTWPKSCLYYAGERSTLCGRKPSCNHKLNPDQGSCCPAVCPLSKVEKMEKDLTQYSEELENMDSSLFLTDPQDEERSGWLKDQIAWLEKELSRYYGVA